MIKLGSNVKITAAESSRQQARAVFEALGARLVTPNDGMDVFSAGSTNIGFEYVADSAALTPAQMRIAPWLEVAVDDVEVARAQLEALGLARLDYHDKEHPYFIGPSGVVFRLTTAAR
jgi:hypothetical protein